jgi:ubiquinone/menaquinone biosynthesis C-methylase UbiE
MMSNRANPHYLLNEQYRDASNLNARIHLHERFSTNPADWFRWVFDHFNLPEQARILELGCGPGMLWRKNIDRTPPGWHVWLSDLSQGMLLEAQANLQGNQLPFSYATLDAQAIPFLSGSLDLVVANHMLYHVPDRSKALGEIFRVLKSGGCLIAATNGLMHMAEVHDLLVRIEPDLADRIDHTFGISEFTIENGADQLRTWFEDVNVIPYTDSLEVTEAKLLIAYILSMNATQKKPISLPQITLLSERVKQEISSSGAFHISKATAIFIAHKLDQKTKRES